MGRGLSPGLEGQTALSQQEMEARREQRKEEAGQGLFAASVIGLTALGTRCGINKQCSFPALLLPINFLPLSVMHAGAARSIQKERER